MLQSYSTLSSFQNNNIFNTNIVVGRHSIKIKKKKGILKLNRIKRILYHSVVG